MEGDYHPTPWSSVCVAQADCILLVAAEGAHPDMGECEGVLVFGSGGPPTPVPLAAAATRTSSGPLAPSASSASLSAMHAGNIPVSGASSSSPAMAQKLAGQQRGVAAVRHASPLHTQSADAPTMLQLLHGTQGQATTASGGGSGGGTPAISSSPPGVSPSILASSGALSFDRLSPLIAAANAAAVADAAAATTNPSATQRSSSISPPGLHTRPAHPPPSRDTSFAAPPTPSTQPSASAAALGARGGGSSAATAAALAALGLGPGSGNAGLAALRRVELVLLHPPSGELPGHTAAWLARRPHLTRHHHIRLAAEADVARLARWMAGRAVGLVLSGGGSRGLAHLGVLCALEDAGVAVDVVGGTSQGAFMAGLYAQGLGREALQVAVQYYARRMGSMRHLLADLTLPLLSLFSGAAFDDALRSTFAAGAGEEGDGCFCGGWYCCVVCYCCFAAAAAAAVAGFVVGVGFMRLGWDGALCFVVCFVSVAVACFCWVHAAVWVGSAPHPVPCASLLFACKFSRGGGA